MRFKPMKRLPPILLFFILRTVMTKPFLSPDAFPAKGHAALATEANRRTSTAPSRERAIGARRRSCAVAFVAVVDLIFLKRKAAKGPLVREFL